jgi:hypothetical protein
VRVPYKHHRLSWARGRPAAARDEDVKPTSLDNALVSQLGQIFL